MAEPDRTPATATARALEEFAARSRTVTRRSRLDAEAIRVLETLARAEVDALLLKGAALARTLYRDGEARGYYDIDLLIAPKDLPVARSALADLGFMNATALRGIGDVAGTLHAEVFAAPVEGLGNLLIDLHWRLDGCRARPDLAWSVLSGRRASIELAGHQAPTLDQGALALHLALHVAQHGPGDLKAVGDLERGLERWPAETWRQAAQLARQLRATEAFAAGLALVPAGAALARELRLPPADGALWEIAHRDERPRGTFHLDTFVQASTPRERLDVLRRSLLPPRAWIVWEYRWAAGSRALTSAAYVLHIARAPVWAAWAWRFRRRPRHTPSD